MTATGDLFAESVEDILAARDREVIKLRDQVNIMTAERGRWEKDVYAAAARKAWDDVMFNVGLYVKRRVVDKLSSILYELAHLPAKPQSRDLDYVRSAASLLGDWLATLDVEPEGSYVAELKRLRKALQEQGQRLHAEGEQIVGEKCRCAGCELIRAAYEGPVAVAASNEGDQN